MVTRPRYGGCINSHLAQSCCLFCITSEYSFSLLSAADKWFAEAKETQRHLNAIIYGNIIYAHCQRCNMERAESLVREMEEEGIEVPIDIYHTMMDGYTIIGNEEKCLVVFERLQECGFTPSVISYGCLINHYTKVITKAGSCLCRCYAVAYLEDRTYSKLAPFGGFAFIAGWATFLF
ncbi:hypothetical protein POM88_001407 [Heracleum sosnowskyi]|uniref:Pentatricopeptide repeat-containing protein n=1 Tax=Heracleum sosnowskyi TaxID=360622 RepID=A0AAD8JG14_9APIA|nr:hypothetical protein POM88_001407 [Heracleum sosnowskyi]